MPQAPATLRRLRRERTPAPFARAADGTQRVECAAAGSEGRVGCEPAPGNALGARYGSRAPGVDAACGLEFNHACGLIEWNARNSVTFLLIRRPSALAPFRTQLDYGRF